MPAGSNRPVGGDAKSGQVVPLAQAPWGALPQLRHRCPLRRPSPTLPWGRDPDRPLGDTMLREESCWATPHLLCELPGSQRDTGSPREAVPGTGGPSLTHPSAWSRAQRHVTQVGPGDASRLCMSQERALCVHRVVKGRQRKVARARARHPCQVCRERCPRTAEVPVAQGTLLTVDSGDRKEQQGFAWGQAQGCSPCTA